MSGTTVGRLIVDAIRAEGVTHAFCVPGESYLGVLDAFNDVPDVTLVTAHHEEGAGFMADAMAKATGRPGVVLVTRAPGATHLSIALHAAHQDSTPLVAIVGQVPTRMAGRESFQEMDLVGFGRLVGKAGFEIREPDRAAEIIQRAFYVAQSGRPGPVLVSIPEDVANAPAEAADIVGQRIPLPGHRPDDIAQAAELLSHASSVAVLAGGGVLRSKATDALIRVASELGCSVYSAWRRFDAFPNDHPLYAGNVPWIPARLQQPLREAEVLLAVGTRLGDFTSLGYALPAPGQRLIQIDLSAEAMSVMRAPDVGILADARPALEALLAAITATGGSAGRVGRQPQASAAHQAYLDETTPRPIERPAGHVDLEAAIGDLRALLPDDTATTTDAGAFSAYLNRYFRWRRPGTFFGTTSGAMGYAVPAAIGVKLADPERSVVAVAGDGGFTMTMSEVHTATRLGLRGLVFLVFDNGTYGTIRLHQTRRFPGREIGVDQGRADLAEVARGLGASAFRVTETADFAAAVREALAAPGPAVVHAVTDPEQIDAWVR